MEVQDGKPGEDVMETVQQEPLSGPGSGNTMGGGPGGGVLGTEKGPGPRTEACTAPPTSAGESMSPSRQAGWA